MKLQYVRDFIDALIEIIKIIPGWHDEYLVDQARGAGTARR